VPWFPGSNKHNYTRELIGWEIQRKAMDPAKFSILLQNLVIQCDVEGVEYDQVTEQISDHVQGQLGDADMYIKRAFPSRF
jgi:hypothetical protein